MAAGMEPISAGDVTAVLKEKGHGVLERCAAILTGYLGAVAVGKAVLSGWNDVRAANPNAIVACDPILGDEAEGLYVPDALIAFYRDHAIPAADVIFPNRFELALLSGHDVRDITSAVVAARALWLAVHPRSSPHRYPSVMSLRPCWLAPSVLGTMRPA